MQQMQHCLLHFALASFRTRGHSPTYFFLRVPFISLFAGKSFDITYVRLKFYSSRPDSFAIYKRTSSDAPWTAYQYYSASCEDTYGIRNREIITSDNQAKAICTDEFSDISPLTGGSVAFSTLEGRPSAYTFEHSMELQVGAGGRCWLLKISIWIPRIYSLVFMIWRVLLL